MGPMEQFLVPHHPQLFPLALGRCPPVVQTLLQQDDLAIQQVAEQIDVGLDGKENPLSQQWRCLRAFGVLVGVFLDSTAATQHAHVELY